MPDEFSPDLGGLESDYRIQTELRHSQRSRTLVARHVGLNRDVTILVLGAPGNEHDNSLTLFASDVRTLSVIRHPNVIPVIEGRWLAGGTFAVVRPRVRGTLLDQVVAAEGPLAASRVATTLEQVSAAIAWARDNGIVHRGLSGATVCFQQGSGRVLVEMEFSPLGTGGGVPDEYDDARTIGRLAFEMLSGHRVDDATGTPIAELRPDLPPRVLREFAAAMSADRRGAAPDPNMLITNLKSIPDSAFVARPPRRAAPTHAPVDVPVKKPGDTPEKGRMGFGARLVILAVISTAVGAAGTLVYRREPSTPAPSPAANPQATSSGGEVTSPKQPGAVRDTPPTTPAPGVTPRANPQRPVEPPATRFHEPLRGAPPATLPKQPNDTSKPSQRTTAGVTSVVDACESFDAGDQRACLTTLVGRGDRVMNAVFDRVIGELRRRANAQPDDADPATVVQLKQAQREWVTARDVECHDAGQGPLYASQRAKCYVEAADSRAKALRALAPGS